eukprot:TRINITY_DN2112_c0_g1_i2.p1 TRINITY_DN2112_c0_g1~~TRINITY_DN2112_c0_g1_i2.p1  ORF type:complete len:381 (+),score=86.31 TRINITY_DN2112_c0_g1_i2:373-1515(+)
MGQGHTKQQACAFHQAVRNGTLDKVKEGLDLGMPLDDQDDVFGTSLHETVCFSRFEVAEMLLAHKADVNAHTFQKNGETVLMVAARKGMLTYVDLFVRSGARVNQTGPGQVTALHLALENGHQDVAKFLLESGADLAALDATGSSPLHIACRKGMISVADALLNKGCGGVDDHDKAGMTPIMYAAQLSNLSLFEVLIKHEAKVTYPEIVPEKKDRKEKSKAKDKDKNKEKERFPVGPGQGGPLHVANSLEIAVRLLELGADVHSRSQDSWTPLHTQCTTSSNYPIVEALLRFGADSNARAKDRVTPLHLSALNGALRNAELLVQYGADTNAIDDTKTTPLHTSSKEGYESISKLLLDNKADKEIKNGAGFTAAQLAQMED